VNAQSARESAPSAAPPRLKDRYDAVIIGGGHNGLVCACYLAGAGLKVALFERRGIVGGAAVTEEFHPGFRNSTASYTVSLLHPKVIHELCLKEHGLKIVERPMANFLPLPGGEYLKVGGASIDGRGGTQAEVARFSHKDAAALPAYYAMLARVADVLRALLLETPPNVGGGVHELFQAWKVGGKLKRLPMAQRRDILDLFTKSAGDILDRWFESEPIKAALGFDAVVGNFASPYTPGSAYVLLHHVFGEVNGKRGQWGHALGGMGAITQAMAREALERGVEIFTDEAVARVLTKDGSAVGKPTLQGPVLHVQTPATKVATAAYTGYMAELDNVRNALRAWALTQGHEIADRPYESYKAGIAASFTENGQFDVYYPLKNK
jgi:phytoene dehydrogenase-like protein